jgi:hypothetical protein
VIGNGTQLPVHIIRAQSANGDLGSLWIWIEWSTRDVLTRKKIRCHRDEPGRSELIGYASDPRCQPVDLMNDDDYWRARCALRINEPRSNRIAGCRAHHDPLAVPRRARDCRDDRLARR